MNPTPLRTLSGAEFDSDEIPEEIVETVIYLQSVITWNGRSKVGKTLLALQLAMCIQAGFPFLGLDVRQAPVLFLSFELTAAMLRERMKCIHQGIPAIPYPEVASSFFNVVAPLAAGYLPQLNLGSGSGRSELERLIRETGSRVVFIDTLYRFIPGLDPNDNMAMGELMGGLNDLVMRTGVALVLIDHTRKGETGASVSGSGIGAQIKGGAARVIVEIQKGGPNGWQMDVESHFKSWSAPLYYESPVVDGVRGLGAVACSGANALGLSVARVENLFLVHGEKDGDGRPFIRSKSVLRDVLVKAKLSGGNRTGDDLIRAIVSDHCVEADAEGVVPQVPGRTVVTREGPRNATTFTWVGDDLPTRLTPLVRRQV